MKQKIVCQAGSFDSSHHIKLCGKVCAFVYVYVFGNEGGGEGGNCAVPVLFFVCSPYGKLT